MQGLGELWDSLGNTAAAETDETEAKRGGWEESGKEEESSRRDVEGGQICPRMGRMLPGPMVKTSLVL